MNIIRKIAELSSHPENIALSWSFDEQEISLYK
jgi:hypothetical protein